MKKEKNNSQKITLTFTAEEKGGEALPLTLAMEINQVKYFPHFLIVMNTFVSFDS